MALTDSSINILKWWSKISKNANSHLLEKVPNFAAMWLTQRFKNNRSINKIQAMEAKDQLGQYTSGHVWIEGSEFERKYLMKITDHRWQKH